MPTIARPAGMAGIRGSQGLLAAVVYLLVRAVGFAVLAWYAGTHDSSVSGALTKWDGHWFLGIAEHGYGGVPGGLVDAFGRRTDATAYAFFPGYPLVVAAVGWLPGVSVLGSALAVNVVSGTVAAVGAPGWDERSPARRGLDYCSWCCSPRRPWVWRCR